MFYFVDQTSDGKPYIKQTELAYYETPKLACEEKLGTLYFKRRRISQELGWVDGQISAVKTLLEEEMKKPS